MANYSRDVLEVLGPQEEFDRFLRWREASGEAWNSTHDVWSGREPLPPEEVDPRASYTTTRWGPPDMRGYLREASRLFPRLLFLFHGFEPNTVEAFTGAYAGKILFDLKAPWNASVLHEDPSGYERFHSAWDDIRKLYVSSFEEQLALKPAA